MSYQLRIEGSNFSLAAWQTYVRRSEMLTPHIELSTDNTGTNKPVPVAVPNAVQAPDGAVLIATERQGAVVLTTEQVNSGTLELLRAIAAEIGGVVVGHEEESR
ncbi:MAG: hypothetical protein AAF351_06840 [Pseudomonadota bacterium]